MKKIGIIGTGIFGTALALTAARAGCDVLCWDRNPDVINAISQKHLNTKHLPNIPLPDAIKSTSEIAEVFDFADIVLLSVSAQATRSVLRQIKPFIKTNTVIVLCAKGIEAETGKMLSEIAEDEIPAATIAILSGPGFAVDIAQRKLTSVTIACAKDGLAAQLTNMLATPYFRPYTTSDMISPQIGDGARAALITRGLNEMGRLSGALGGRHGTMMGMCGLGDLVLTAGCSQSRNFSFGYEIGIRGEARKLIEENTRTVEGIYTAQAVVKRACELGIEMPICEVVNKVLFAGISIKSAMESLMSRPYKEEGF